MHITTDNASNIVSATGDGKHIGAAHLIQTTQSTFIQWDGEKFLPWEWAMQAAREKEAKDLILKSTQKVATLTNKPGAKIAQQMHAKKLKKIPTTSSNPNFDKKIVSFQTLHFQNLKYRKPVLAKLLESYNSKKTWQKKMFWRNNTFEGTFPPFSFVQNLVCKIPDLGIVLRSRWNGSWSSLTTCLHLHHSKKLWMKWTCRTWKVWQKSWHSFSNNENPWKSTFQSISCF